jgi:hypothetical protein
MSIEGGPWFWVIMDLIRLMNIKSYLLAILLSLLIARV